MNAEDRLSVAATSTRQRLLLAVASGVMLGASFPPSPVYSLAYVGLIPLLLLLESLEGTWQRLRYAYCSIFVFHAITIYWIGGFVVGKDIWMMVAGAAVLLFHPLFYFVVFLPYFYVRKRLGLIPALVFLPLMWVSYEYSHSLSEFSFPWLTLGNSQAYDLPRIQIAEYTSVYGLSFLIVCFNIIGFVLIVNLATRRWLYRSRTVAAALTCLGIVYFGPWVYGKIRMNQEQKTDPSHLVHVGVVQPNIDPWDKWGSSLISRWESYDLQLAQLTRQTKTLGGVRPDLVVWPETAIPFRILLPSNEAYLHWLRTSLDSLNIPLLTGLPYTVYYDSANAPSTASWDPYRNRFYDDYNSTTLFVPGQEVGRVYKKIVLVPFAERIPYAGTFKFLIGPLKWNVGIGMWGKGADTVIFALRLRDGSETHLASMICYESVYPNFVREFVKRGAEFLVILTNDSWWGNTSGAYQHASFASFRAVENRRWIVRSANGGISGFVDPCGIIYNETALYTRATLDGTIEPRTELTYYARHGDVFALACAGGGALILLLSLIPKRYSQADYES